MKVKSSIFMQNVRVYKVLFQSHLHFIQSLKVKLQGSAKGHTRPPPGMPHWPESGSEVSLEDSGQGGGNRSTTSRQKYQWRAMVRGPGEARHPGLAEEQAGPRYRGNSHPATENSLGVKPGRWMVVLVAQKCEYT